MSSTHAIAERLRSNYLFNNIENSLFEGLIKRIRVIELKTGSILFHQGDPAEQFFYIETGQIKLSRISTAGQEKVIEVIGDSDLKCCFSWTWKRSSQGSSLV